MEYPWPAAQLVHSWYLFFHLDPRLPEQIAEAAGETYLRWFFEHGSGPGSSPFTDADVAEYARWFTRPGRATAGFNLYRTAFTIDLDPWRADHGRVLDLPTLWIHGLDDPFVPAMVLDLFPHAFTDLWVVRLAGYGYWVPEEVFDLVVGAILEFLSDLG